MNIVVDQPPIESRVDTTTPEPLEGGRPAIVEVRGGVTTSSAFGVVCCGWPIGW
jgi:hypothetical protein